MQRGQGRDPRPDTVVIMSSVAVLPDAAPGEGLVVPLVEPLLLLLVLGPAELPDEEGDVLPAGAPVPGELDAGVVVAHHLVHHGLRHAGQARLRPDIT